MHDIHSTCPWAHIYDANRNPQVNGHDDDDHLSQLTLDATGETPSSPPPSFRSRTLSPPTRRPLESDHRAYDADQNLADTFDDGDNSDAENDGDDRQRLMRGDASLNTEERPNTNDTSNTPPSQMPRTSTEVPTFVSTVSHTPSRGAPNRPTNDGVFANLAAKPERGEVLDEKPPTYEQAAADATPPYWETTIVAPGMTSGEVYVA